MEEEEEMCPDGSQPDAQGQCPMEEEEEMCPDGSQPDAQGQCPMEEEEEEACPDGSQPDAQGQCPMEEEEEMCPDGGQPDAQGQCPMEEEEEEACPDGAPRAGNGLCPVNDENRDRDGTCLHGLPDFATNTCPPQKGLDDFMEDPLPVIDNTCSEAMPSEIVTLPGPLSAALEPIGNFDDRVARVTLINSAAVGINLVDSIVEAQDTGDSSAFFDNLYDLVLPILPGDNAIRDTFTDFSEFTDLLRGC